MAFLSIESFKSGCHPGPCLCLQPFRAKPAMWMNTSTTSTYASRSKHAHSCVDEGRDGYVGFNPFLAF